MKERGRRKREGRGATEVVAVVDGREDVGRRAGGGPRSGRVRRGATGAEGVRLVAVVVRAEGGEGRAVRECGESRGSGTRVCGERAGEQDGV